MTSTKEYRTRWGDALVSLADNPDPSETMTFDEFLREGMLEEWMRECGFEIVTATEHHDSDGIEVEPGEECVHGFMTRKSDGKEIEFWYPVACIEEEPFDFVDEFVDGTDADIVLARDEGDAVDWLYDHCSSYGDYLGYCWTLYYIEFN